MKKTVLGLAFVAFGLTSLQENASAQVNLNVNVGAPAWLQPGLNSQQYVYFPSLNIYYYIPTGLYYAMNGNRWVGYRNLPPAYNGYNLRSLRQVPMNVRTPYRYNSYHLRKYHGVQSPAGRPGNNRPGFGAGQNRPNNNRPGNNNNRPGNNNNRPGNNNNRPGNNNNRPGQRH